MSYKDLKMNISMKSEIFRNGTSWVFRVIIYIDLMFGAMSCSLIDYFVTVRNCVGSNLV